MGNCSNIIANALMQIIVGPKSTVFGNFCTKFSNIASQRSSRKVRLRAPCPDCKEGALKY